MSQIALIALPLCFLSLGFHITSPFTASFSFHFRNSASPLGQNFLFLLIIPFSVFHLFSFSLSSCLNLFFYLSLPSWVFYMIILSISSLIKLKFSFSCYFTLQPITTPIPAINTFTAIVDLSRSNFSIARTPLFQLKSAM